MHAAKCFTNAECIQENEIYNYIIYVYVHMLNFYEKVINIPYFSILLSNSVPLCLKVIEQPNIQFFLDSTFLSPGAIVYISTIIKVVIGIWISNCRCVCALHILIFEERVFKCLSFGVLKCLLLL